MGVTRLPNTNKRTRTSKVSSVESNVDQGRNEAQKTHTEASKNKRPRLSAYDHGLWKLNTAIAQSLGQPTQVTETNSIGSMPSTSGVSTNGPDASHGQTVGRIGQIPMAEPVKKKVCRLSASNLGSGEAQPPYEQPENKTKIPAKASTSRVGIRDTDASAGQTVGQIRRREILQEANAASVACEFRVPKSSQIAGLTCVPSKNTDNFPKVSAYLDSGDCNCVCEFCDAFFWFAERLRSSPKKKRPRYTTCCRSGRVDLPRPLPPPPVLAALLSSVEFMPNIRPCNCMFSMTSFGAIVDENINQGTGPYVFKVEGQVSHWLGSLCPSGNSHPRFLQLYIHDTDNEVRNRMRFFQNLPEDTLSESTVESLISMLGDCNKFVKLFKTARDMCLVDEIPDFEIHLYNGINNETGDGPVQGSIGGIVSDGQGDTYEFDVIIHSLDSRPHRVSRLHPTYMPLQYPLLFPYGETGWCPTMKLLVDPDNRLESIEERQLSMNMFYTFQIHDRLNVDSVVLRGGRLFQQYLVDVFICIEQNRLDYVQRNQNLFRTEHLRGVHDAISKGDTQGSQIGKRTILPTSFTGGPRYMYKHYQDAIAICGVYGNPQYFITFTCNVKWPEIQRYTRSKPNTHAQDRPDIISRVFQMKVQLFIDYLKMEQPFGEVCADLYTIEFQKRGLPHCHALIWVTQRHRITQPSQLDNLISAEIPDVNTEPILHKLVISTMIHGPCGPLNEKSTCMKKGTCSKKFPKQTETQTRFDKDGNAKYRRRPSPPTVLSNGTEIDNGYVVPYNRELLRRFEAHINVEYCGWSMMIKYLFKYISKGPDRVKYAVSDSHPDTSADNAPIDEVSNFITGRYICPHEASWRILNFPIHERRPAVQVLSVHLEGMQNVSFRDSQQLTRIVNDLGNSKTTLTEWFLSNSSGQSGRHLSYADYLKEFRWDTGGKCWIRRSTKKLASIGRMVYIHPASGELFYLKLLLRHQNGCTSFSDLRTVNGIVCQTYRAACEKFGLLGDDREWFEAFSQAADWATASELRTIFSHMLLFCEISSPRELWKKIWKKMGDDILRDIESGLGPNNRLLNDDPIQQRVLYEMEVLLRCNGTSSSLVDYGLPLPTAAQMSSLRNRLLMEEKNFDQKMLQDSSNRMKESMHPDQLNIFNYVMHSFRTKHQCLVFIYGHGGTGKTYLWTTLIGAIRATRGIVLAVAGSGIASLLLPAGRTAHSRFKIPIDLTDESICDIKKNTHLSQLLIETSVIVWDEAPMSDRRCFESLDKSLRDILDNPDLPFGGKSVLLGGDFRQTLPIKPKCPKSSILDSCLPKSYLWPKFRLFRLTVNLRLLRSDITNEERLARSEFSEWLLALGNGDLGICDDTNKPDSKTISIPEKYLIPSGPEGLDKLISFIYTDEILRNPTAENIADRAIVCPRNDTANEVNSLVHRLSPGFTTTYLSNDSMTPRSQNRGDIDILFPPEYLNLLEFTGLPPHHLELKVNSPIILLRNVNQALGLCNGTRLIVTQLLPRVIIAHIVTGVATGTRVFITRIPFIHNDITLPFIFKRRQFPVRTCYAMTINKSQGQSLNKVGVYLATDVFGHGQLYVALSRATSPDSLKILLPEKSDIQNKTTRNVVYSDFLKQLDPPEVGSEPIPLLVRVGRSWKSNNNRREKTFLLIDTHGDAIQATCGYADIPGMTKRLIVGNCYRINGYACDPLPDNQNTVLHQTEIRLVKLMDIIPLEDDETIPRNYFNFIDFDGLQERHMVDYILTDFVGKLKAARWPNTKGNKKMLKLTLRAISGEEIEAILWEEVMSRFDVDALTHIEPPVVAAFTSGRVTDYRGELQLLSTQATHVYFNPDDDRSIEAINIFREQGLLSPPILIRNEDQPLQLIVPKDQKYTIGEVIKSKQEHPLNHNQRYICDIQIIAFIANRVWHYQACKECGGKQSPQGSDWICGAKHSVPNRQYRFCVNAVIKDPSGSATATFFNDAIKAAIKMDCTDVVNAHPDKLSIPPLLNKLKHKTMTV